MTSPSNVELPGILENGKIYDRVLILLAPEKNRRIHEHGKICADRERNIALSRVGFTRWG